MVEAFSANCSDLHVILVDDHSDDKTATVATRGAEAIGQGAALTVIHGNPLPEGWTGKLWAVSQGLKEAQAFSPDYCYSRTRTSSTARSRSRRSWRKPSANS
jgi:hypothetical protein